MVTTPQHDHDIIEDIFAAVIDMAPAFREQLEKLAREKRDKWAGDRPFISRRAGEGRSQRNEQLIKDYLVGERVALLSRRYNLTERRILQIIKQR